MNKIITLALFCLLITVMVTRAQNPVLWGMTSAGGGAGNIFTIGANGTSSVKHNFGGLDGYNPNGALLQATDSLLYGVDYNDIFSFDISTGREKVLYRFTPDSVGQFPNGNSPNGPLIQATDGLLYGTTQQGGTYGFGVIFSYNIATGTETTLYSLDSLNGQYTTGSLIEDTNGLLYGEVYYGGSNDSGAIYSYNITSKTVAIVYHFKGHTDGAAPVGSLLRANNGLLYGVTYSGGANDKGVIFSYSISSDTEIVVHSFGSDSDAVSANAPLIQGNDSLLYGTSWGGGIKQGGTIFSYNILSGVETPVYFFNSNSTLLGYGVRSTLLKANNGLLYGMTDYGGNFPNTGTLFSYDISTGTETDLYGFGFNNDGYSPVGSLIQANNGLLYGLTQSGGLNDGGTIFNYAIASSKENNLHSFYGATDGTTPYGSLIRASDGLMYGLTFYGGENLSDIAQMGYGTLFSYNISTGEEIMLHSFGIDSDGSYPYGSLLQVGDSLLYGTTSEGGRYNQGTIFSYNIFTNAETDVYDFGIDTGGTYPFCTLIKANNGLLYGMTIPSYSGDEFNSIFNYNPSTGQEKNLYTFTNGTAAGNAYCGTLLQANNGLLYGMTTYGGAVNSGSGLLFSFNITTNTETNLHEFGLNDGEYPEGSLIQASDGLLYGMTSLGGANYFGGIIFSYNISTDTETDVHDFGATGDGSHPYGSLVQASDGLLYGMTVNGGTSDTGVVFSYNISTGTETVITNFNGFDGGAPYGNLIEVDNPRAGINQLPVTGNKFLVYPSPTTGNITITSQKNIDAIKVTNVLGQLVYQSYPKQTQTTFDIKAEGMYFVTVTSGGESETRKIVVSSKW